nr:RNA polymerase sigma-70 factor [Parabacteroides goldsteinii]
MEQSYEILLAKIADGDEKAFHRIWDIYYLKLFRVALYFIRSKELSEEVVSDIFFILWQKRNMLPKIDDLDKYLYVAVKNQALQYLKKQGLQNKEPIDLYTVEFFHDNDNPELRFLNNEFQALVQKAINSLPDKCKEVFRLHFSEKLKQREIAVLLDISEKTVGIHIMNAYKRISQYVNHEYSKDEKIKRMLCIFF